LASGGKGRGKGKSGFMVNDDLDVNPAHTFSLLSEFPRLEKRQRPKGSVGKGITGNNGCGDVERGHSTGSSGLAAHMSYASNGFYINAASCFIKKKLEERMREEKAVSVPSEIPVQRSTRHRI
jgi:hypothetical protein